MSVVPRGFQSTAHSVFFANQEQKHAQNTNIAGTSGTKRQRLGYELTAGSLRSQFPGRTTVAAAAEEGASSGSSSNRYSIDCAICLEDIVDPVSLIMCDHYFCCDCIVQWYKVQKCCPLCKERDASFVRATFAPLPSAKASESTAGVVNKQLLIPAPVSVSVQKDGIFHLWRLLDDKDRDSYPKYDKDSALVARVIEQHRKRFHAGVLVPPTVIPPESGLGDELRKAVSRDISSVVEKVAVSEGDAVNANATNAMKSTRMKKKKKRK